MTQPSGVQLIYQDNDIIVVSKPSGMVIHRGWADDEVTVADVVRDEIAHTPVFAMHRLDRGTSGLVIFALTAHIAREMQKLFDEAAIGKVYLALVRGPMLEGCVLDYAIPGKPDGPRVPAITTFRPLSHSGRWSLVEARPQTGRMHQIRRHLKHLSHPIVGDVKYGKGPINRMFREEFGLARMALHAYELSIPMPGKETLELCAPVPADFHEPLSRLGMELRGLKLEQG